MKPIDSPPTPAMRAVVRWLARHPRHRIRAESFLELVEPADGQGWRSVYRRHVDAPRVSRATLVGLERRGLVRDDGWHGTSQLFVLTDAGHKAAE